MIKNFTKSIRFYIRISFTFCLIITGFIVHSQEYPGILNSLNQSEAQHLESLVEAVNPTVYVTDAGVQTVGNGSTLVAKCEADAINKLYDVNASYNDVQLIRIDIRNLSDFNNVLKPSLFQSFTSLSYIYLFFQYDACGNQTSDCFQTLINQFLGNEQLSGVQVIYRLGIIQ